MADIPNPDYNPRGDTRVTIHGFKSKNARKSDVKARSKGRSSRTPGDQMRMDPENMPVTHYDKRQR